MTGESSSEAFDQDQMDAARALASLVAAPIASTSSRPFGSSSSRPFVAEPALFNPFPRDQLPQRHAKAQSDLGGEQPARSVWESSNFEPEQAQSHLSRLDAAKTDEELEAALAELQDARRARAESNGKASDPVTRQDINTLEWSAMPTRPSRGRQPASRTDDDDVYAPLGPAVGDAIASKEKRTKKSYPCLVPDCGKTFSRAEHLKRHQRSLHTEDKRASVLSSSSDVSAYACPYPALKVIQPRR